MAQKKVASGTASEGRLLELANFVLQKYLIRAEVIENEKMILNQAINKLEQNARIIYVKNRIKDSN